MALAPRCFAHTDKEGNQSDFTRLIRRASVKKHDNTVYLFNTTKKTVVIMNNWKFEERATRVELALWGGAPQALKACVLPLHYTRMFELLHRINFMSKGIASKNSLKSLAHPLQQFLAEWGLQERTIRSAGTALPAPYQLAALRGEAVLRYRFFNVWLSEHPITFDDAQQVYFWNALIEEGGYVTSWVQRLGIAKAMRREAALSEFIHRESRQLYCVFLDALSFQQPSLLPKATDLFFEHIWKAQFPSSPVVKLQKATSIETLREKLNRALCKYFQENVSVKESFKEADNVVQFKLLKKLPSTNRWEELVSLERPRLKTARVAAYDVAITNVKGKR